MAGNSTSLDLRLPPQLKLLQRNTVGYSQAPGTAALQLQEEQQAPLRPMAWGRGAVLPGGPWRAQDTPGTQQARMVIDVDRPRTIEEVKKGGSPHPKLVQVGEFAWRGKQVDEGEVTTLAKMGFRSTLNLREGKGVIAAERAEALAAGMNFLNVAMPDRSVPHQPLDVKTALDFMANPANQPVYVHCQKGVGRTGITIAAYRMAIPDRNRLDGNGNPRVWTADEAIAEARRNNLSSGKQIDYIRKFEGLLKSGQIPGYPRAEPLPLRDGLEIAEPR